MSSLPTMPPEDRSLFSPRYRNVTIGLLLAILTTAFEAMAVATILPEVAKSLDGLSYYGWAFSAFLLSNIIGTIVGGELIDRMGSAKPFAIFLLIFGLGLVVAGSAGHMAAFVLGRFLQGFGAGGLNAVPFSIMSQLYPDHLRAKLLASISSAWVLPSLFGPILASTIAAASSWHMVFYSVVPLLILVGFLTIPTLQHSTKPVGNPPPFNVRRFGFSILLAVGAAVLLAGLSWQQSIWMWPVTLTGVLLTALASREILPSGIFRFARGIPSGIIVRGCSAFAFFGSEAFMPLGLIEIQKFTVTQAGLLLTVGGVSWSVGSILQARMDSREGPERRVFRVRLGMALLTVGIAISGLSIVGLLPSLTVVLGWAMAGLGMGLGYATNSLIILGQVKEGESGKVSSQLNSAEVLLAALSAGIGGALVAWSKNADLALDIPLKLTFLMLVGVSLLTWVAARRVA
ncbi:MFS transporter [Deinococcus cellulosilyticus]|uniref:MFS transporter n=1 Tax=Deinococcus cellulosilyticus (strain DSM 18568 / NBRC 106333 / KACC 11606 / 5516J-15) TaxID=1223518 RepID=A0A511N8Z4_DEIC1|nr:MFS transporter [Deinococcus cellulosilyticus]GEM48956.1 MFS transporter [Deinococcus cellulosilyticus NBRC 106333 = KACC 11606]